MKRYHIEIRISDLDEWISHSETMDGPEGMISRIDWDYLVKLTLEELKAEIAKKQADEAGAEDGN
jgi:hypothetical protein